MRSFIGGLFGNNSFDSLCICRAIILTYGLWDQVRVDKGREWYLSLYINETLSSHRYCTRKPPHLQTTSKKASSFFPLVIIFFLLKLLFSESYH
jgi:hypothetical protein